MTAKYYTYRNLWKGGFSTKQRGIVVSRFEEGFIMNAEFRVSVAGNERAVRDQSRNVHAYAVCETRPFVGKFMSKGKLAWLEEVKYNPFRSIHFTVGDRPISGADTVYFFNGKCYAKGIVYK